MTSSFTPQQVHELIAAAPEAVLEVRAARARRRVGRLWWLVPLAGSLVAAAVAVLLPHLGAPSTRPTTGEVARPAAILVLPLVAAAGVAARMVAGAMHAADAARLPGWYGDDGELSTRADAVADEAERLLRRYAVGPPPLEPAAGLAAAAREMLAAPPPAP